MKRHYSILLVICMIASTHAVGMEHGSEYSGFIIVSPLPPSLPLSATSPVYAPSSPFPTPPRVTRYREDQFSPTLVALDLAYPYVKKKVAKSPGMSTAPKILPTLSPLSQPQVHALTPNNLLIHQQSLHNPADRSFLPQSSPKSVVIRPLTPSHKTRLRAKTTQSVPIPSLEYMPSKGILERVLYCCWCAPTIRERSPKEKV